ncbi:hypothetical protein N7492_001261 [Penicillium capsulatum]|uniref:Uncharacterized protein n=1 Tax=Penicillium capsulatum TaxID=69766 RepID=A0A9W9IV75_9EURO|nr:hypothetical protein N7492_001261 [Penicillium capsulatum]KAJ6129681.1 hypothetical protein N7512_002461 [Penicillium capsulatum]
MDEDFDVIEGSFCYSIGATLDPGAWQSSRVCQKQVRRNLMHDALSVADRTHRPCTLRCMMSEFDERHAQSPAPTDLGHGDKGSGEDPVMRALDHVREDPNMFLG